MLTHSLTTTTASKWEQQQHTYTHTHTDSPNPAISQNGRVLKEDVLKFIEGGNNEGAPASATSAVASVPFTASRGLTEDKAEPITGIKSAMVKSMTAALKVPHFSYADEVCTIMTGITIAST